MFLCLKSYTIEEKNVSITWSFFALKNIKQIVYSRWGVGGAAGRTAVALNPRNMKYLYSDYIYA